ncbi:holo-ACP synthase [Proteiniborus ethanoligenes]|uniref:citrate lyase holo-[acyl-carrier protein] synthase n=1 Tax=Proteiniborus ethanoligenes TaxID=415015 RepID=A0A1H3L0S7_9FIRM|nr:citrate lyase holo-[acyl-carrier protein] synthase [Proteiniborus ethanoligenes]SDY57829.1 holo-ACP synthase [Proteiniborus ethanoligenes]
MIQEDLLQKVLEAKEERAAYQEKLITKYKLPLISLTLNLPGGYFQYSKWQDVMAKALEAIEAAFTNNIVYSENRLGKWGPEGFWIIDLSNISIKKKVISIEDGYFLGRLFDIDVIDLCGKPISRRDFNMEPRKCIVCENNALNCYINKKHTLEELKSKINEIIEEGLRIGVEQ